MTTLTSTTPQMSIYTDPLKTQSTYLNTNIIGNTVGVTMGSPSNPSVLWTELRT